MKYLILYHKFSAEAQLHSQTFKMIISVLKFLYSIQFNPLSYVACYILARVVTSSQLWFVKINISKFDHYKSFTLIKLNDVQFLRELIRTYLYTRIKIPFFGKKLYRHKLKFCCVICKYM